MMRYWSMITDHAQNPKSSFAKKAQKWPDQNSGGLQNGVRDFNNLARNLIGYRYTIPQWITQRNQ
jgi:hypothetical protein